MTKRREKKRKASTAKSAKSARSAKSAKKTKKVRKKVPRRAKVRPAKKKTRKASTAKSAKAAKKTKKTSRAASKSAVKSGAKRRKKTRKASTAKSAKRTKKKKTKKSKTTTARQLELQVLGEPVAPSPSDLDPQEAADNELVKGTIAPKNANGVSLTRHEMAAYKRWLNRNIVRFRDAGMKALPQTDLERLLGTPRKVILEWEAAGLPRNGDKLRTYNLFQVIPWLKKRWLDQAKGTTSSPEAVDARQRKLVADARKREIEVEVLEHSLIPRAEAGADRLALVETFTAILNRLPADFRSAFASVDVAHQGEWLDEWQVGEREQLITQGGIPTTAIHHGGTENTEAAKT